MLKNGSIKNGTILSQSTGQVGLGLRDSQQGKAQPETGHPAPVAPSQRQCRICKCFMAKIDETPEYARYQCPVHLGEVVYVQKTPTEDGYWVPPTKEDLEILELKQRRKPRLTPEQRRSLGECVKRRRWRPTWTQAELTVLRSVYLDPRRYMYEAAELTGRTVNAVACKACEMGLRKKLQEWPD